MVLGMLPRHVKQHRVAPPVGWTVSVTAAPHSASPNASTMPAVRARAGIIAGAMPSAHAAPAEGR
jgi:hypothetical protein